MKAVRPKKQLGQHFLTDLSIAEKIARPPSISLITTVYLKLAPAWCPHQFLPWKAGKVSLIEVDTESVNYLQAHYASMAKNIHEADFFQVDLSQLMGEDPFAIIRAFPTTSPLKLSLRPSKIENKFLFFGHVSKRSGSTHLRTTGQ